LNILLLLVAAAAALLVEATGPVVVVLAVTETLRVPKLLVAVEQRNKNLMLWEALLTP
jgi:hypothetical protein